MPALLRRRESRVALISLVLVAASFPLALARPAAGATILSMFDDRYVTTHLCGTGGTCFDSRLAPAPPSSPFDAVTDSSAVPGSLGASQHSSLGPYALSGSGGVQLSVTTPGFTGSAGSSFDLQFLLDSAAQVTLIADLSYSGNPSRDYFGSGSALVSAVLCPGLGNYTCIGTALTRTVLSTGSFGLPSDARHVEVSLMLPGGTYSLRVGGSGQQNETLADFASVRWSFALAVPEPESLAPLALASLALLWRKRGRA
jgi:hypothetical protein